MPSLNPSYLYWILLLCRFYSKLLVLVFINRRSVRWVVPWFILKSLQNIFFTLLFLLAGLGSSFDGGLSDENIIISDEDISD